MLGSFGLILILLLYIFAVIAVHLFALVDLSGTEGVDREMGPHANFRSFSGAFLTLFRCVTGEAWNSIMFEVTWSYSILYQCNPDETYDTIVAAGRDPMDWNGPRGCGDSVWAPFFF